MLLPCHVNPGMRILPEAKTLPVSLSSTPTVCSHGHQEYPFDIKNRSISKSSLELPPLRTISVYRTLEFVVTQDNILVALLWLCQCLYRVFDCPFLVWYVSILFCYWLEVWSKNNGGDRSYIVKFRIIFIQLLTNLVLKNNAQWSMPLSSYQSNNSGRFFFYSQEITHSSR